MCLISLSFFNIFLTQSSRNWRTENKSTNCISSSHRRLSPGCWKKNTRTGHLFGAIRMTNKRQREWHHPSGPLKRRRRSAVMIPYWCTSWTQLEVRNKAHTHTESTYLCARPDKNCPLLFHVMHPPWPVVCGEHLGQVTNGTDIEK